MNRRLYTVIAALAASLLPAALAVAQPEGPAAPPTPVTPDMPPAWIYYMLVILLAAAGVMISIMPSKRGHQD